MFGPRIVDARWSAAGPGILVVFRGRRPAAWRRETASKHGSYFETGPYASRVGSELWGSTRPSWMRETMSSLVKTLRRW